MARTVPGRSGEGLRVPDVNRHLAGLPIVAGGAAPGGPLGQWRDAGLARNLAWVADGAGAVHGMAWKGAGLSGTLTDEMHVRVPVPSASLARVRLRVWAEGDPANTAAISIESATVGPSAVTVGNGPATRYPAPGSDVIIDAGPDVVVDPDAGPYVDLVVKTSGEWGALSSVHLDLVEPGAPANYPTHDTTLAAGIVGDFVPADTDDYVAGLPLGADTLFEHAEQWPEQWDRRKVAYSWAEFDRTGGAFPPPRKRAVFRSVAGASQRLTFAIYVPSTTNGTTFSVFRAYGTGRSIERQFLAELRVAAGATPGWHMMTTTVRLDGVDLGSPAVGLDAFGELQVAAFTLSAAVPGDASGVGYAYQVEGTAGYDAVYSAVVWIG
jgi:hypothetical protein